MSVVIVGLSHHSAPVPVREKFAFAETQIPEVLDRLRSQGVVSEGVILSTCNRVEIYAATDLPDSEACLLIEKFLVTNRGYAEPVGKELYRLGEPDSLQHLFKVACGLDSMVLGETEILGQLKKAYELALQHKLTGGWLNKAFQKAFNVAKLVRSETNIQRGSISVASVGVELAEKIFGSLDDRHVMVLGAGDTSEKAARALLSRGAKSIIVSNRSFDRAESLAKELGGRAIHFDQWASVFGGVDIVVSSTAAPHYILDRARLEPLMRARQQRPLLLIDLAVPRDIEPEVNFLENIYLYNVDDLQAIAVSYLQQRREEITACEKIINDKTAELIGQRRSSGFHPAPRTAGA